MGNRSSAPTGPPPLLSAAVMGNVANFQTEWKNIDAERAAASVVDSQQNNVLHALFSCRVPGSKESCLVILDQIHNSLSEQQLTSMYEAQNNLGCTPIWILVAYGNIPLLENVQSNLPKTNGNFIDLLVMPNHQGDSPLLATCSQGNTEMVQWLQKQLPQDKFSKFLTEGNQKGTTPLQIVLGNGHLELLEFLLKECDLSEQLLQSNAAGLSLFHICSERNFDKGLKVLLNHLLESHDNKREALDKVFSLKDLNNANPLHVASFCGNLDVIQVWVDTVQSHVAEKDAATEFLDRMDGHARTAYWLAMVQGHEEIGRLLASEGGVDTSHPNMLKEIEEAKKLREQKRQQAGKNQPLLGR